MIKPRFRYHLLIACMVLYPGVFSVSSASDGPGMELDQSYFEHIQFGKISPNQFTFHQGVLVIRVDDSASLMMKPFKDVRQVHSVNFEWQLEGTVNTESANHEKQRDGDDAVFKLGLLLKGDSLLPDIFAPGWLKRVRELLPHPSENMINLVADAKHTPGEQWSSPYNKRVSMISVKSAMQQDGWWRASYSFPRPLEVVAVWLMADGDNTHSSFTTRVRNIVIE